MLTVSEIENKKFSKAIIGGYDTEDVNEFLSKVAEDYDRLLSENDTLKGKLKLLVEKLEEYRDIEDSLRKALFTAEKTADKVKEEARHRCESMLKDTQLAIEKEKREAARQQKQEIIKLQEAKNLTAGFVKNCMALYNKQIQLLTTIPNLHIEIDDDTDQAMILTPKEMAVRSATREISDNIVREENPSATADEDDEKSKAPEEIVFSNEAGQALDEEKTPSDFEKTRILAQLDVTGESGEKGLLDKPKNIEDANMKASSGKNVFFDFEKAEMKREESKKEDEPHNKNKNDEPKRRGLEVKVIELNLNKPLKAVPKPREESSLYEDEEEYEEPSKGEKFEDLKFGKKFDIRKNRE